MMFRYALRNQSARRAIQRQSVRGQTTSTSNNSTLPEKAETVIIGGGVVGCSVAYHLRKRIPDSSVLLLEQGLLGCGTTWHAAGLVGQLRPSKTETLISGVYGASLYEELEALTGLSAGFTRCGSVSLARTPERLDALQRQASRARSWGLEVVEVSAARLADLCGGLLDPSIFVGGIHLPADGKVDASNVCSLFAAASRRLGAELRQRVEVTNVVHDASGYIVSTNAGEVRARCLVNCAGQWSRKVGELSGINVPLHSCQHFYVYTRPGSLAVPRDFPVVRDPDSWMYSREWSGGLLVGSFEPNARPVFENSKIPPRFEFQLLESDWDHFLPYLERACEAFPSLASAEVDLLNGPESFTVDGRHLVGESLQLPNYFVAAGMNSTGIASAGGVGKQIADWIGDGRLSRHLWSIDFRRVQSFQSNQKLLRDRAIETLGNHYALMAPKTEPKTARGIRRSPLYSNLAAAGAKFGVVAGWEQPNYFDSDDAEMTPFIGAGLQPQTWGKPAWYDFASAEYRGCMEGAAVFDTSAVGKLLVVGSGASAALSWLCANQILGRGGAVLTPLCNQGGGIEALVTVRQFSSDAFLVVTSAETVLRDKAWIESEGRQTPGANVLPFTVLDVSSMYSMLTLAGPTADLSLMRLIGKNPDTWPSFLQDWPVGTERVVDLGFARGRVMRGMPGYVEGRSWELLLEADVAEHVHASLIEASAHEACSKLMNAGHLALDMCRVSVGFPRWGLEISCETSPMETGLDCAVAFGKKGGFVGEAVLFQQKSSCQGRRMLCMFTTESIDPETLPWLWGGEPILIDGEYCGQNLTSAARIPGNVTTQQLHRSVGMGLLSIQDADNASKELSNMTLSIEVGSEVVAVQGRQIVLPSSIL